ncbi:hypothetical protein ACFLZJ_01950 [Nanoarchaeota archaeon]
METQKANFIYKKKNLVFDMQVCKGLGRIKGLMFVNKDKAKPLLFEFKTPTREAIHSLFVSFPFIAIWLDDKNKIIDLRIVKPFTFTIRPERPFKKLIEIPINGRNPEILEILVGKRKI